MEPAAANGELPLHQHTLTSSDYTYAQYWSALTASSDPSLATTRSHNTCTAWPAQRSPPPRHIHAATGAYRLQLLLSPSPTKPPAPSRDVRPSKPLQPLSPNTAALSAEKPGRASVDSAAHGHPAGPLRRSPVQLQFPPDGHDAGIMQGANSREVYGLDPHVLQAVRCYEEWRRCVCAEEAGVRGSDTVTDRSSSCASSAPSEWTTNEGSAVQGNSQAKQAGDHSHEDGTRSLNEENSELDATGIGLSPIAMPASLPSHGNAPRPEPACGVADAPLSQCGDQTHTVASPAVKSSRDNSRSLHYGSEAQGLTSARPEQESVTNSSGAAVSPGGPTLRVSPMSSPFMLVSPMQEHPIRESNAMVSLRRPQLQSVPLLEAAPSTSPISLPTWDVDARGRRSHADSSARQPEPRQAETPSRVQRKLFVDDEECSDDGEYRGGEAKAVQSAKPEAIKQLHGSLALFEEAALHSPSDARGRQPLVRETVIELSCDSSATEDTADVSVCSSCSSAEIEHACQQRGTTDRRETQVQLEDEQPVALPPAQPRLTQLQWTSRAASEEAGSNLTGDDSGAMATVEATQATSAAPQEAPPTCVSSSLFQHPLCVKHRSHVAAVYGPRLLPNELANEELQLFLCWAEEKHEAQLRRSLQYYASDTDAETSLTGGGALPTIASDGAQQVFRVAYSHRSRQRFSAFQRGSSAASSRSQPGAAVNGCWPPVFIATPASSRAVASLDSEAAVNTTPQPPPATTTDEAHKRVGCASKPHANLCRGTDPSASQQVREELHYVTPTSAPSRFIAWIADDVDVFEELLR